MTDDLLEAEKESIGIKVPSMRFARCTNAKQVLVAADEQLPLADSRAAGGRFLQVVFRHHFKLFAGPNDGGDAAVGHKIGEAVGGDGTRAMAAAEAFHPVARAFTRIKAARDAGIGHDQKIIPQHHRRRHIRRAAPRAPGNVGFGDIAAPVGPDGEDMALGITAGDKDVFAVVHHRGHKLFGGAVNDPMAFAGGRVMAGDGFTAAENHLVAAVNGANERRAVAACLVFARRLPAQLASGAVQCGNVRLAIVIAIHNHQIPIQHGAGTEAVRANERPDVTGPFSIAL